MAAARRIRRKGRASVIPDQRIKRVQAAVAAIGTGTGEGGAISVAVTDAVQAIVDVFQAQLIGLQSQVDELIVQARINNIHNQTITGEEIHPAEVQTSESISGVDDI